MTILFKVSGTQRQRLLWTWGDKTTFVALKGLADCRILVAELTDRAVEALAPFGSEAESLRGLAQSLAGREK